MERSEYQMNEMALKSNQLNIDITQTHILESDYESNATKYQKIHFSFDI